MTQPAEGSRTDELANTAPLIALPGIGRIQAAAAIAALKNINLQIETGDRVAIVGASGNAKSSLVNLLCGIDYPSSGEVLWNGQPVRRQAEWAKLRRTS